MFDLVNMVHRKQKPNTIWIGDLMRVKNNTLLFGTVMEKENYEKTVKMSFF